MSFNYKHSIKETRAILKSWGYCLLTNGVEMETYPKYKRGNLSYFSTDRDDILTTVRAEAIKEFRFKLKDLPISNDIKDALTEWYSYHRNEWRDELLWKAWFHGRYDGFSHSNVRGILQSFRNTNGHSILTLIK